MGCPFPKFRASNGECVCPEHTDTLSDGSCDCPRYRHFDNEGNCVCNSGSVPSIEDPAICMCLLGQKSEDCLCPYRSIRKKDSKDICTCEVNFEPNLKNECVLRKLIECPFPKVPTSDGRCVCTEHTFTLPNGTCDCPLWRHWNNDNCVCYPGAISSLEHESLCILFVGTEK